MGRRGADDEQYWEFNKKVRARDKNACCICRILTPGEYVLFMKSHPAFMQTIDVAHIIPVGRDGEKYCDMNNAVCLCRCHHQRLDSFQDPITGKHISAYEHGQWWERVKQFVGIKGEENT